MPTDWLTNAWKFLVIRGVIALIFGIVAIAAPVHTAIAFALLWGFWALFDGIGSLIQAFQPEVSGRSRLLNIIMGVIALLAAFFAITSPGMTAATLTWILGIWLIVRGAFEAGGAFSASDSSTRWSMVLSAVVDVVLGVLFVAHPGRGAVTIATVLGIIAVAWGIILIIAGFMARKSAGGSTGASTGIAGTPAAG